MLAQQARPLYHWQISPLPSTLLAESLLSLLFFFLFFFLESLLYFSESLSFFRKHPISLQAVSL